MKRGGERGASVNRSSKKQEGKRGVLLKEKGHNEEYRFMNLKELTE